MYGLLILLREYVLSTTATYPSGDLPTMLEPLTKEAEDDLRDGGGRDGVRSREGVMPLASRREFIEALRKSVGVEERASRLWELGLRRRGLWGAFPFGEKAELLREVRGLDGDNA
jgi:hypothetical protein